MISQLGSTAKKALNNEMHERVLVFLFIDNSNRRLYAELVKTLAKKYLVGQDNYSWDMATAHKLLVKYKPMKKSSCATSDGIIYATNRRPRNQKNKIKDHVFSIQGLRTLLNQ